MAAEPIRIVAIHGISTEITPHWWHDWRRAIEKILFQYAHGGIDIHAVTWEPEMDKQIRRPGRIPDLLGDIAAIYSPVINTMVYDAVLNASKKRGKVWVMGHSLGSVLAYQACLNAAMVRVEVDRLITFGCPLWRLEWPGLIPVVHLPRTTRRWHNVWGLRDWVCGPFWRRWSGLAGLNAATTNWMANCSHDAERYLRSSAMVKALAL